MRAIDTNVLVRLITRDDEKQTAVAEEFVTAGAWVPHLVLVEAIWVLTTVYELSKDKIVTAVQMLMNHADLTLQDSDVVAAALARYRGRSAPEFSDCMVIEVSRKAGHLPLGTFDRALGALEGGQRL
jgi:predicted nucleic-acid-binding protein